jgi:RNA polymerase sigma-70 factor (ECF subfamily)
MPQSANSSSEDIKVGSEVVDYDALVRLYYVDLYRFVRRRVSAADADDIVQDTFLQIIRKGIAPEKMERPRGFVLGVARNMILRHMKKGYGRQSINLDEVPDVPATAESTFPTAEDLRLFEHALDASCTPVEREVIMHALRGESNDEIAQATNLTESNIRVLKHRAILKMRTYLGSEEVR